MSTLARRWRRHYLSWFSRHGVWVCTGTAGAWVTVVFAASVEHRWWVAGPGFAAAVASSYAGLLLHDNPADPDDPDQDYF